MEPDKLFGDRTQLGLMLNSQPTTRQRFEFVRSNQFTPGFVQTVDLSGKIRFNTATGHTRQPQRLSIAVLILEHLGQNGLPARHDLSRRSSESQCAQRGVA